MITHARQSGVAVDAWRATATRWASATFTGARHLLELTAAPAEAAGRWVAGLADAELPLRGHLVADIAVVKTLRNGADLSVRIEVLTVEER